jgi:hypothetical protein
MAACLPPCNAREREKSARRPTNEKTAAEKSDGGSCFVAAISGNANS